MKRILTIIVAGVLMGALWFGMARAQQPPFIQLGGGTHSATACSGANQFGGMLWCFDNPLNATKNLYYWNGTAWTILPGSGFNPAAPGAIGGTTPAAGTFTTLQANTSVGVGVLNTTEGTLTLNGGTSGAITIEGLTSGAGTYNLILPTSAGAIGSLLTSGGGSSQQVWLADGATGTILTGAGATTIPAFSAIPSLGTAGSVAGTLGLANGSGGGAVTTLASGATSNWTLTTPVNVPSTSGQVLSATTGGVASWVATDWVIPLTGELGVSASTAGATLLVACDTATRAGHLTTLNCTSDISGTCTTAPTFGTRDTTSTTNGTGTVACGNTAGVVAQATPGLAFAAGDQVCITRTVNGGTCTTSNFAVMAHTTTP